MENGARLKKNTRGECDFEIPENMFSSLKMNIGGICHELTNLIDHKQKVRMSEGNILESSHKTFIGLRINKGNAQWEIVWQ